MRCRNGGRIPDRLRGVFVRCCRSVVASINLRQKGIRPRTINNTDQEGIQRLPRTLRNASLTLLSVINPFLHRFSTRSLLVAPELLHAMSRLTRADPENRQECWRQTTGAARRESGMSFKPLRNPFTKCSLVGASSNRSRPTSLSFVEIWTASS
jgi:hypothetical protein